MLANVSKWGNSFALRIPSAIAKTLRLHEGDRVQLAIENGTLVVRPEVKAYTLDTLLAGVTPENLHAEVRTGSAQGEEF